MSGTRQRYARKHAKRAWGQKARARANRRVAWARPYCRLHVAIDRTNRLIESTQNIVADSEEQGAVRPIQTSRELRRASHLLFRASVKLLAAGISLEETKDRAAECPPMEGVPELVDYASECWEEAMTRFMETSEQLSRARRKLFHGLRSGRLMPEPIEPRTERRPRIIVRIPPLLIAARAFLLIRRSSVRDRIASVPVRRRRQALIVVTDAPRQISRGRAPPSPDC